MTLMNLLHTLQGVRPSHGLDPHRDPLEPSPLFDPSILGGLSPSSSPPPPPPTTEAAAAATATAASTAPGMSPTSDGFGQKVQSISAMVQRGQQQQLPHQVHPEPVHPWVRWDSHDVKRRKKEVSFCYQVVRPSQDKMAAQVFSFFRTTFFFIQGSDWISLGWTKDLAS